MPPNVFSVLDHELDLLTSNQTRRPTGICILTSNQTRRPTGICIVYSFVFLLGSTIEKNSRHKENIAYVLLWTGARNRPNLR